MKKWFFCIALVPALAWAQGKVWNLENCIEHALKNSLDIQQAAISTEQSEITYNQSKLNMVPDLTFGAGQFYQGGRSIDRFTNQYVQSSILSNNFQLQSGMLLFGGGQVRNTITANRYLWMAGEADQKSIEQNISLNVANLFLQVVQGRELVRSAKDNLTMTGNQLDRAEKFYAAGTINEGQVLNLRAQQANDQATIINGQNQEQTALNSLKMLLRIPFEDAFDIDVPPAGYVTPEPYDADVKMLYDSALSRRPDVQAAGMRSNAAQYRYRASRGALYPSLTVGGSLSSVFSGNAKEISNTAISGTQPIGYVQTSNEVVLTPTFSYTLNTISFADQVKNNFGQSLGLNLSVPIFSRLQGRSSARISELEFERSKLLLEKSKQNLYNEVVTAYNAYNSAKLRYEANALSQKAQEQNLDFVQKRYDAGQASVTELQVARATFAQANNNLTSVRYEYLFRRLVLDFYMGLPIKL